MAAYQEAQKTESKKDKPSPKVQTQTAPAAQSGVPCPNCGASNPEEALFCAECGASLGQRFCPNCGAQTSAGADICPVCKAWLLEGQCKFCYAPLSVDAAFCPECGNPKDGIPCPSCGALSIFDFCTNCGKPLTEGALKALELAKDDPEAQALVKAIEQTADIESELAQLEAFISNEPEPLPEGAPPPERKSLFSDRQLSAMVKTGEHREAAAQRRIEGEKKAEEEARKQKERERLAKINEAKARKEALEKEKEDALAALNAAARKFAHKTFLSHQEARRWHIARRHPNAVGWLCKFTNTVHMYPEGPNGCDQPGLGGCDYFGETIAVEIKGPA